MPLSWNIVFVGAGGSGLSNLVGILRDLGFHKLIGIDSQPSQITEKLQAKGIKIFPHWTYKVTADDILIYSSAAEKSEEVQQAKNWNKVESRNSAGLKAQQRKPLLIRDYFEFLGEMSKYFKTVAFTGTNGKSSSTAMAIFAAKEILPEFWIGIVGALVPDFNGESYVISPLMTKVSWSGQGEKGGSSTKHLSTSPTPPYEGGIKDIFNYLLTGRKLNYDLVKKYYFFLEACEYQRHFLTLDPDTAIITSLELDHMDYFKDREDYQSAFWELIEKVKGNVYALPNLNSKKILTHPKIKVVPQQHFDFQHLRGDHQQQNASLVYALLNALTSGTQQKVIKKQIEQFRGIRRRMEELTTTENGTKIFSDYGHVTSSLEVGLKALKEKFPEKNLICIFQPHQMHRILQGRNDFPTALAGYNERYIYNIYAARENFQKIAEEFWGFQKIVDTLHQSARQQPTNVEELGEIFSQHCNATYLTNFNAVEKIIEKADANDIIIIYSAGDIDYELRKYLKLLKT